MSAVYHFRFSQSDEIDHIFVIKILKQIAKKWKFQLEQGESSDYRHYQGVMSLRNKKRETELLTLLESIEVLDILKKYGYYLKPQSKANNNIEKWTYVMKADTRISGPWTDEDKEDDINLFIPWQIKKYLDYDKLRPFQKQIVDSITNMQYTDEEYRQINYIYDEKTNQGKSIISTYIEFKKLGYDIGAIMDYDKLIGSVCNILTAENNRNPKCFCFDIPKGIEKKELRGLISGIEQIKKGKVYDIRHKYKSYWFNTPQIWVFSNMLPDFMLASRDRWKIWVINDNKELEAYPKEEMKYKIDSSPSYTDELECIEDSDIVPRNKNLFK